MRERYVQLLIALLLGLALYPIAVETGLARWFRLALVAMLAASAYAVSGRRRVLMTALALGVPAIAAQAGAVALPGRTSLLIAAGFALLFLAFVTVVIFGSVLAPGKVTRDKIAGAISVYLLLGMVWALLYIVLASAHPGTFDLPAGAEGQGEATEYTFFYFSFVTLTTLGYGDITPVSPVSQTLAWLQAVVGQLYLAILVARLVGLHIVHSGQEESAGGPK